MSKEYIVYKYILRDSHDDEFKSLIKNKNLEMRSGTSFRNKEMLKKWIYHLIVTFGRVKSILLFSEDDIIHYSFYTPYCYKFSFMDRKDYVIGPCWTAEKMRGNRIYPITINKIGYDLSITNKETNVYLLVRPENKESTHAIVHTTGWIPVGKIQKTMFKNYKKCKWNEENESFIN